MCNNNIEIRNYSVAKFKIIYIYIAINKKREKKKNTNRCELFVILSITPWPCSLRRSFEFVQLPRDPKIRLFEIIFIL